MLHIIMIMLINNPNCTPKYLFSFKSFVKSHMDNLDQLFFFLLGFIINHRYLVAHLRNCKWIIRPVTSGLGRFWSSCNWGELTLDSWDGTLYEPLNLLHFLGLRIQ